MKVLMVSEDIPSRQLGGLGKHVVRLGNALIDQGHSVELMGRADIEYRALSSEIGFRGPFLASFGLKRSGWRERQLGMFVPFKRPHLAKKIARAIMKHAGCYDVIHYHGHYPLVGSYIPRDVNFIQTRHDQGSDCLIHSRFRNGSICHEQDSLACGACCALSASYAKRAVSAAAVRQYRRGALAAFMRHKTVFVSAFLKQRFEAHIGFSLPGHCRVIHNFVDTRMLPDDGMSVPPEAGTTRAVIVARIDETKGVLAFLEAFSCRSLAGVRIEIVGDGPLRAMAERLYGSPNVRFAGWEDQNATLRKIQSADIVVVPSIWEEPCGTTVLEGLAMGKSVLALARGGNPELKAFQRWETQLRLFDTLDELVAELPRQPITPGSFQGEFKADVSMALPKLLAAYRDDVGSAA